MREWLKDGAQLEDAGNLYQAGISGTARYLNHFHNPYKTYADAGLHDFLSGMSAVLWAQDSVKQEAAVGGNRTWSAVREFQYRYLTALNKTAENDNLALMLMGLGHQMHLIQDMSQPDHVRNDAHPIDGSNWFGSSSGIETWAKLKNRDIIRVFAGYSTPKVTVDTNRAFAITDPQTNLPVSKSPVTYLSDTRQIFADPNMTPTTSFSQGLAEYTATNFFSEDTIFAANRFTTTDGHYFPYPRKQSTNMQAFIAGNLQQTTALEEDGTSYNAIWIKKTGDGEPIDHLAREGNLSRLMLSLFGEGKAFYKSFDTDEVCFNDYAKKLIPAAVGYSKALLDYFYRGELTVTVPPNMPPTNKRIRLYASNSTPTSEAMDGGSIDLVVIFRQYKKDREAAYGNLIPDGDFQFRKYTLAGCPDTNLRCKSIDLTDTLLDFDLSNDPLPLLARDISLIVVYRGKLGNEPDSLAFEQIYMDDVGGELDLSLPARGVYASVSGDDISSSFTDFALAARNSSISPTPPGSAELLIIYREAQSDPFQSHPVDLSTDIKYVSATIYAPNGISTTATTELPYSLVSGIPVKATDVYAYLIHTSNSLTTYGYLDISEPTPVDLFNNTDKVCINKQWYTAGSAEAIAQVDANHDGIADQSDVYSHNIENIFEKASQALSLTGATTSNYTFQSPGLLTGGNFVRLGFILTDYNFDNSFREEWINTNQDDHWADGVDVDLYHGSAVKNQTDASGNRTYPVMFNLRGSKIWGGAGVTFVNTLDEDTECGWDNLNQ